MARPARLIALLVAFAAAACGGFGPIPLDPGHGEPPPRGAQVVHVTITSAVVSLQPDTVRAGDVYLVLDAAPNGSMVFIGGAGPGVPENAPLDPAGLARIRRGDAAGTSSSGLDAGGCSPEQDAAGRGKLGPCGNVSKVVVRPGIYALAAEGPETLGGSSGAVGVLTVVP